MKINKPCAILDMPIEVYHAHPALSNSGLKTLLDCPARYYSKYLSGKYARKEDTAAFKIGKAAHCYILEGPKAFEARYWHNPYGSLLKNDIIELLKALGYGDEIKKFKTSELTEMLLAKQGIVPKEIELNKNELNQVVALARSINENPLAKGSFKQKGKSEVSLFWQDEETGIWLKCRPDWLPDDRKNVPDYKTCTSVNPVTFYGDFIKYGYHVQCAMYRTGVKAVFDTDVKEFFFVAQEKEEPCISQVFLADETLVLYGEKAIKAGINKYLECKEKGIWESYSDRVIELSIQPKPDELASNFDKENSICYAPYYLDRELMKYEV